jgi:hypothetical protein
LVINAFNVLMILAGTQSWGVNWVDSVAGAIVNSPGPCGIAGVVTAVQILLVSGKPPRLRERNYLAALLGIVAIHVLIIASIMEREATLSDYLFPLHPRLDFSDWFFQSLALYPAVTLLILRLLSPWNSIFGPAGDGPPPMKVIPIDESVIPVMADTQSPGVSTTVKVEQSDS